MKKTRLLVILSLWVLLFASPALAGAPAVKLVITDLQNGSEIVVAEPALLGFFALFDFQGDVKAAKISVTGIGPFSILFGPLPIPFTMTGSWILFTVNSQRGPGVLVVCGLLILLVGVVGFFLCNDLGNRKATG